MPKLSRIQESRDTWRKKATQRRLQVVSLLRKCARSDKMGEALKQECELLKQENVTLREQLATSHSIIPMQKAEVRLLCVFMFCWGKIPCNALVRLLELFKGRKILLLDWVPDASSVVNWVARAGLGYLDALKPSTDQWVAIIDTSISYGKDKMLVCLRVPLEHFLVHKCAVSLEHIECVGLVIKSSWNGQEICSALHTIFTKVGAPLFIVKDQGADLKAGVRLLKNMMPGIRSVRDIGHVAALLLKKSYAENSVYKKFLKMVDVARARLCHAELAFLRPPKIRAKGRFQSISRLVKWAEKMCELTKGAGSVEETDIRFKLREVLPGIRSMRFFFARFSRDCSVFDAVLGILKNQGLNQTTNKICRDKLKELPRYSKIRKGLEAWLTETMSLQCRLGIGQTPLLVSSDILESLFGVTKSIIERTPSPEFGTLSLATPLLCGEQDHRKIAEAMQRCSQKSLTKWKNTELINTHRRTKTRLFPKKATAVVQDLRSAYGP